MAIPTIQVGPINYESITQALINTVGHLTEARSDEERLSVLSGLSRNETLMRILNKELFGRLGGPNPTPSDDRLLLSAYSDTIRRRADQRDQRDQVAMERAQLADHIRQAGESLSRAAHQTQLTMRQMMAEERSRRRNAAGREGRRVNPEREHAEMQRLSAWQQSSVRRLEQQLLQLEDERELLELQNQMRSVAGPFHIFGNAGQVRTHRLPRPITPEARERNPEAPRQGAPPPERQEARQEAAAPPNADLELEIIERATQPRPRHRISARRAARRLTGPPMAPAAVEHDDEMPLELKVQIVIDSLRLNRHNVTRRQRILRGTRRCPEVMAAVTAFAREHPEQRIPLT